MRGKCWDIAWRKREILHEENVEILHKENVKILHEENVEILHEENVEILHKENVEILHKENVEILHEENVEILPRKCWNITKKMLRYCQENVEILHQLWSSCFPPSINIGHNDILVPFAVIWWSWSLYNNIIINAVFWIIVHVYVPVMKGHNSFKL